ncbi:MAG: hypothetical protein HKN13_08530, partial [Rhodothermales bacterium]|nr:hypothetical protein [Rhodothermales bacterium]
HFDCAIPGSFGVYPSSPAVGDVVSVERFRARIEALLRQSSIPGSGEYCIELGGAADVVAAGSEVVLFWELETFGLYKARDADDQLVAAGWGHDGGWIKRPHANRSELWQDMRTGLAEAVEKLERDWLISRDE